ncbi:AAA family ATPase [Pseudomonas sp. JS3066]|jgi:NadR type nicotinamide-nucleotide adenylyltransferase|uniref:AAA family ATPase n=1 Tax=unclassified Pseudomonas TaxID=196821 RepID=UPI000EA9B665|nr:MULTISPECIES: AAA family ATPase [unclassified Pseudomonas]AYF86259.1 N-acetylglucosamine-6-sulfatase [Pseudomonas sp. DY-1]WVK91115.1 AAA family ATPase [Pseudomonas sp. JS3066]
MKVLVLTGPESSGKSWLAATIQAEFGGLLVGEYVRHFIEREQRDTCYADIPAIARGQLEWEDNARAKAPPLLILDTHLLSNILWSRKLFKDCPEWLERELLSRSYDLHLLLSPQRVEWVDDGQRCQPELADRMTFFEDCRSWLDGTGQRYEVIEGDWQSRRLQVLQRIARWLR